jgi:hypothetical protein
MTICARRLLTSTSTAFSAATFSTATLWTTATLLANTLLATARLFATPLVCALKGCWMHAGSATISFGPGLVTIATHGGTGPFATECTGAIAVCGWVLNASVASN